MPDDIEVWAEEPGYRLRAALIGHGVRFTAIKTRNAIRDPIELYSLTIADFRWQSMAAVLIPDTPTRKWLMRINGVLLEAVQAAYRKHVMDDESVGWQELEDRLQTALQESMGDKAFQEWLKRDGT